MFLFKNQLYFKELHLIYGSKTTRKEIYSEEQFDIPEGCISQITQNWVTRQRR